MSEVTTFLRWHYDGSGGWFAESGIGDDGQGFMWRIGVCDDGTFDVSETCQELTSHNETFDTLELAKQFCQQEERDMLTEFSKENADDPEDEERH